MDKRIRFLLSNNASERTYNRNCTHFFSTVLFEAVEKVVCVGEPEGQDLKVFLMVLERGGQADIMSVTTSLYLDYRVHLIRVKVSFRIINNKKACKTRT